VAAAEEMKEEKLRGHPRGHTAVLLAAARGHTCVLRALLSRGADAAAPNVVDGVTPLMAAAAHGHTSVIDELLQALHRCQVKHKHTPAHPPAREGSGLLPCGGQVLCRTQAFSTPIM
jgi:ankyrin repeat protein